MSAFAPSGQGAGLRLAIRFAARELRGGVAGFRVFLACLALGVAAIVGVGGLARGLTDGLAAEGRVLLGGDLAFTLVQEDATAEQKAFLDGLGRASRIATIRAMARGGDGEATLTEIKAVDAAYPLAGTVAMEPAQQLGAALSERGGRFGVLIAAALTDRLGVAVGGALRLGDADYEVRAVLTGEPDAIGGGVDFGPRVLMSEAGLAASGLIQPGSLVNWSHRVALADPSDAAMRAARQQATGAFPDAGWRIRDRLNVSPRLERNIDRFTQFLTLVGLTALVVGGVGAANAVGGFVDAKREAIASLKCLGASGSFVVMVHLLQILALAALGIAIGLVLGAAIPFLTAWGLGALLPMPFRPGLDPANLALGAAYGLLTALAFALWPLGRAHDISVSALFRDALGGDRRYPRRRYMLAAGAAVALLVALAIAAAYDRWIATLFVGAAAVVFLSLRVVAGLIMATAARIPRPRRAEPRLALANIHRPGALTPSVVLSLGLGLTLMIAIVMIEGSLRRQLSDTLPGMAPSFFFLDVPAAGGEGFEAFLRQRGGAAQIERVPMLRGRIVSLKGIKAEDYPTTPESEWVLRGDRGITFAATPPEGSTITSGAWWPENHDGPPQVSFGAELARELNLAVGDEVTVSVLGRTVTARIANLREIEWERLGINFVMVFSPDTFRGAPFTWLATLAYPDGGEAGQERGLLRAVADAFPSITAVRVKEALDTVNGLVGDLALAIRSASAITLLSSVLVLAGALAAGHRQRVYDAVVLKTLGATRKRLLAAFTLEYAMLGAATAVFALLAGSGAAWFVVARVMRLTFAPDIPAALTAASAALVITVALGLAGTWRILGEPPAAHLRNL